MGLWDRLKSFGSSRDDEAAEREEFGGPDRGEAELRSPERSARYGSPAAQVAEDDLEEFEAPKDPAP
jgi:hypothetical protein